MIKTTSNSSLPLVISELRKHLNEFHEIYKVSRIGVFGSVSRQEDSPDSDVDILIDFISGKVKYRVFIALADTLEDILNRPVDLVTVNGLSPYVRPIIEKEVIWVYG